MNLLIWMLGFVIILAAILSLLIREITYAKAEAEAERYSGAQPAKPKPKKKPHFIAAAIGLAVIILSASFTIVPTGYTGVRTTFGLIDQESCNPGFNFTIPGIQKISLVNNKQQDLRFTERVWAETKEQTVVYMENIQVSCQVVPEQSAWIYAHIENWIEQLIDQDSVGSSLKAASRMLSADVVTDRDIIEPLAKEKLQEKLDEKYGAGKVLIKTVIINNMDFDDSYNAAIASKSEALQQQQEQAIRNQTNIDQAAAEAEAARVAAQGKADAALIEAEGKAKANEIISNSITDATQRQDTINKWNGELPKYMGNDGNMFGIFESVTTGPDGQD